MIARLEISCAPGDRGFRFTLDLSTEDMDAMDDVRLSKIVGGLLLVQEAIRERMGFPELVP